MARAATIALAAALTGCGGGGEPEVAPDAAEDCDQDERADVFAAGMSRTGEAGYVFTIVDSPQVAPIKGVNTWDVALAAPGGDAADVGLAVETFMPDHGHAGTIVPTVEATAAGAFHVTRLFLSMSTLWEVTLIATDGATPLDAAVFRFCVDG